MEVMSKISVESCYNYTKLLLNYRFTCRVEEKGWECKRQRATASSWSAVLVIRNYNEPLQYVFLLSLNWLSNVTDETVSTAWKPFSYVTSLNSTTNQERRRTVNYFGRDYFNGKRILNFQIVPIWKYIFCLTELLSLLQFNGLAFRVCYVIMLIELSRSNSVCNHTAD